VIDIYNLRSFAPSHDEAVYAPEGVREVMTGLLSHGGLVVEDA
jgi:hypothetical protein